MALYYYAYEGVQQGPIEEQSLYELFASKVITMDSLIWTDTFEDWTRLKDTAIGYSIATLTPMYTPIPSPKHSFTESDLLNMSCPGTPEKTLKQSFDNSISSNHESDHESNELWIEDDKHIWIKAEIIDVKPGIYCLRNKTYGKTFELKIAPENSNIHRVNIKVTSDITSLTYIHEAAILHNLKSRYSDRLPYTFIGSVLIAVNPLRLLPQPEMIAYIQSSSSNSSNSESNQLQPHPYALAETAYQQLSFSKLNQSVVISGESGSGKTETAKIILKYLVNRATSPSQSSSSLSLSPTTTTSAIATEKGLDVRLLQSSPILESFGNAKTGKNNNSSRFGKFMKLIYQSKSKLPKTMLSSSTSSSFPSSSSLSSSFMKSSLSQSMTLLCASVETYLLEKSRVVHQSSGERNFHIFYRLLAGIQNSRSKIPIKFLKYVEDVKLMQARQFNLLNQSGCTTIDDIKEETYFDDIIDAFYTIGFTQTEIEDILAVLYGILVLGNITFVSVDSLEGSISAIQNPMIAKQLSKIFCIEENRIHSLLLERKVLAQGENFIKRLSVMDSIFTRDAVTKSLYESLFQYIVNRVNQNLDSKHNNSLSSSSPISINSTDISFIGVLDIFGFEHFIENHFEQLLINYANEVIQNTFNRQVFDAELRLYQNENLEFTISSIPDNTGCVDLISDKTSSILFHLDAISRQPKASDERFCDELHKAFGSNKNDYFLPVHPKDRRNSFVILHYAGGVKYSINLSNNTMKKEDDMMDENSWVSKNNDTYPDDLINLCQDSRLVILNNFGMISSSDLSYSNLISKESLTRMNSANSTTNIKANVNTTRDVSLVPRRGGGTLNKPTISSLFTKSMRELNTLLQSTSCQFVRCIKPNRHMTIDQFENHYVIEQLRSLGVLQTCEVLKAGLPTRISYVELKDSLQPIIQPLDHLFNNYTESVVVSCILRAYGISEDIYKLGRTMIFFKAGQLAYLRQLLYGLDDSLIDRKAITDKIRQYLREADEALEVTKDLDTNMAIVTSFVTKIRAETQELILLYAEIESTRSSMNSTEDIYAIPKDITLLIESIDARVLDIKNGMNSLDQNIKDIYSIFVTIDQSIQNLSATTNAGTKTSADAKSITKTKTKDNLIPIELIEIQKKFKELERIIAYSLRYQAKPVDTNSSSSISSSSSNSATENQSMIDSQSVSRVKKVEEDYVVVKKKYVKAKQNTVTMSGFLDELSVVEKTMSTVDIIYSQAIDLTKKAKDGVSRCKLAYTHDMIRLFKSRISDLDIMLSTLDVQVERMKSKYANKGDKPEYSEIRNIGKDLLQRLSEIVKNINDFKVNISDISNEIDIIKTSILSKPKEEEEIPEEKTGPFIPIDIVTKKTEEEKTKKKESEKETVIEQSKAPMKPRRISTTAMSRLAKVEDGSNHMTDSNNDSSNTSNHDPEVILLQQDLLAVEEEIKRLRALAQTKGLSLVEIPNHIKTLTVNSSNNSTISINVQPKNGSDAKSGFISSGLSKKLTALASRRGSASSETVTTTITTGSNLSTTSISTTTTATATGTFASNGERNIVPVNYTEGDINPLPDGWKEHVDKSTNRPYYINSYTKVRQWSRPIVEPKQFKTALESMDDDVPVTVDEIRPVDRSSKRLDPTEVSSILKNRNSIKIKINPILETEHEDIENFTNRSHLTHHSIMDLKQQPITQSNPQTQRQSRRWLSRTKTIDRTEKVTQLRQIINSVKYELTVTGKPTLSRLEEMGYSKKTGYLLKQSKVLGRWKKRFFVLDNDVLSYYDSAQDASMKTNSKELILQPTSAVSYTAKDCCFLIKLFEREDRSEVTADDWYLTAESESEMEEWIVAINSHILRKFKTERNITTDFFDTGEIYTSFWRLPPSSNGINRIPVGIRTLPYLDSPRTLEGIHPGEIVEATQVMQNDGNTFLRLADDRGWVYEKHWKVKYDLLQRVDGEYMEQEQDIRIDETNGLYHRIVFSGPSIHCGVVPIEFPPSSVVRITSTLTILEGETNLTFGKLKKERGWIVF